MFIRRGEGDLRESLFHTTHNWPEAVLFSEASQHAQGQGTEKSPTPQLNLSGLMEVHPAVVVPNHYDHSRVVKSGTMFSCQRLSTSVAQCLLKLKEARGGAMLCDKQKHHNSGMTSGQSDPITPWRVKDTSCGTGDHVWRKHEINRFFLLWAKLTRALQFSSQSKDEEI